MEGYKLIELESVKKDTYYISENGEIYSTYKKDIIKPRYDKDGYLEIALSTMDCRRKFWKIHQLVARVYIGNPPSYMIDPTVDHINGIRKDNHYRNLRWIERSNNSSIRKNKGIGEMNHEAILNEIQVIEICELLIQKKYSLQVIADLYHVKKSTISNIKRKKNWTHLTNKYNFEKHHQKNKIESFQQKEEILQLFKNGMSARNIIKNGYPQTVVYRYKNKLKEEKLIL